MNAEPVVLHDRLSNEAILARLIDVLTFANMHIEAHYNDERFGYEVHPMIRFKDKVVVEASLLLLLASRVSKPSDTLQALTEALKQKLAPMACGDRAKVLLKRHAGAALVVGFAPTILLKLGVRDKLCEAALYEAWQSGYMERKERLPFREMEVRWFRSLYYDTLPTYHDLISMSILGSTTHPVHMTRNDIYALTHALMYVTDFASKPLPLFIDRSWITQTVDAALAWCLMIEDIDVMLELLISAITLNHASPYVRFAWRFVLQIWDELGFLPAPRDENSAVSLIEEARQFNGFHHVYHPTFLGGMLCAMMLNTQEAVQCANRTSEDIAPSIRATIEQCGGLPAQPFARWIQTLCAAPLTTEELNVVMYDATLIHAVKTYRLDVLDDLLRDMDCSHAHTSTYYATVEFLRNKD